MRLAGALLEILAADDRRMFQQLTAFSCKTFPKSMRSAARWAGVVHAAARVGLSTPQCSLDFLPRGEMYLEAIATTNAGI